MEIRGDENIFRRSARQLLEEAEPFPHLASLPLRHHAGDLSEIKSLRRSSPSRFWQHERGRRLGALRPSSLMPALIHPHPAGAGSRTRHSASVNGKRLWIL